MKTLISERELRSGVDSLADQMRSRYCGKPLMVVGMLPESIVFVAELMRRIDFPVQVRILQPLIAHNGPEKPEKLSVDLATAEAVPNHHVLIVDGIVDTGATLLDVLCQVDDFNPISVSTAALLCKRTEARAGISPHHVVFEIPNEIVVGYGFDYQGCFRNLPYIAALEEADRTPRPPIQATTGLEFPALAG